jgi:RNA-directed DNA polymerase
MSKSYRVLDRYTLRRLRRWLCDKHKVRSYGYARFPDGYLYTRLGLVRLSPLTQTRPRATA